MNSEDIIVSIIIPIYNVEKYLNDCIISLRRQTHKAIEIILVDDKSLDHSVDIARKHGAEDSRIIVYSHDKNKKQGAARNTGLRIAKGKYIMFLDSDDIYPLDAVANMLIAIEQTQADMVIGKMAWLRNGKITPVEYINRFINSAELWCDENLRGMPADKCYFGSACNCIYNLEWLKKCGITFVEGVYWEDVHFSVSVWLHAQNIAFIPKTMYLRTERIDENNLSTTQDYDMKKFLDRDYLESSIFNAFFERCKNNASLKNDITIILQRIYKVTEGMIEHRNDNLELWVQEWYRGYKKRHSILLRKLQNI